MSVPTLERLTMIQLRLEAARRLGCTVTPLDPETGHLNEIQRGPLRRALVGGLSPLNDAVASRLVGDKEFTGRVLEHHGYAIPRTVRCLKPGHFRNDDYASHTGVAPALALAKDHGYPLVVKPNNGSRGLDIAVVDNAEALEDSIEQVWKRNYLALAQVPVGGYDLRIDFLDGEFLFGYTRQPVRVTGDGHSPVRRLLAALDPRMGGEAFERHLEDDPIWQQRLVDRPGLGLGTLLGVDEVLDFDTPILNLNRLCVGQRLESLPESWTTLGVAIGRALSLRHYGIDLKIQHFDQNPRDAVVIEVNSSPSLVHMARIGHLEAALDAERKVVTAILADEAARTGQPMPELQDPA